MITDLRLQKFRSYTDASFEFGGGVNIIVGPNGSGKTNLLEAILVITNGRSYRVKDAELLQFSAPWARLDVNLANGGHRTVKIVNGVKLDKTYELDDKVFKRLTHAHSLPVVLFEPNHLQLLAGSPERRREYLDDLLEQTVEGYGSLRRLYKRTLAQRNALLKQSSNDIDTQLFPWNLRLSQLAGQIVRARTQLVEQLVDKVDPLYRALSGTDMWIEIIYQSRWPADTYETSLMKKLEQDVRLDQMRGFTGAGPHREDIALLFAGRPAAEVASRGESRTLVLALKITELQLIKEARNVTPILLLDDVFSELDGKRRHALTDYLAPYQTFITTTEADIVVQHFTDNCQIIPLG